MDGILCFSGRYDMKGGQAKEGKDASRERGTAISPAIPSPETARPNVLVPWLIYHSGHGTGEQRDERGLPGEAGSPTR